MKAKLGLRTRYTQKSCNNYRKLLILRSPQNNCFCWLNTSTAYSLLCSMSITYIKWTYSGASSIYFINIFCFWHKFSQSEISKHQAYLSKNRSDNPQTYFDLWCNLLRSNFQKQEKRIRKCNQTSKVGIAPNHSKRHKKCIISQFRTHMCVTWYDRYAL